MDIEEENLLIDLLGKPSEDLKKLSEKEYKSLIKKVLKKWHPDINRDSNAKKYTQILNDEKESLEFYESLNHKQTKSQEGKQQKAEEKGDRKESEAERKKREKEEAERRWQEEAARAAERSYKAYMDAKKQEEENTRRKELEELRKEKEWFSKTGRYYFSDSISDEDLRDYGNGIYFPCKVKSVKRTLVYLGGYSFQQPNTYAIEFLSKYTNNSFYAVVRGGLKLKEGDDVNFVLKRIDRLTSHVVDWSWEK